MNGCASAKRTHARNSFRRTLPRGCAKFSLPRCELVSGILPLSATSSEKCQQKKEEIILTADCVYEPQRDIVCIGGVCILHSELSQLLRSNFADNDFALDLAECVTYTRRELEKKHSCATYDALCVCCIECMAKIHSHTHGNRTTIYAARALTHTHTHTCTLKNKKI